MSIQIHDSWKEVLAEEFSQPYFSDITTFLIEQKKSGVIVFPSGSHIFTAFDLTPFDKLKVVILGQDPYHGPGQAHGLSFSVPDGIKIPPSLKNMYKEIIAEQGGVMPDSGNLAHRATQGVFLLNAILTVEARKPASHKGIGRERFTDKVIHTISQHKTGVIFLLRGNFAKQKKELIDTTKHIVLEAPHPSPFSAHTGFFGCNHFHTTNQLLQMQGKQAIKRIV